MSSVRRRPGSSIGLRRGGLLAGAAILTLATSVAAAGRPARGEPLLWRVERRGATSYLFGTCHLPIGLEKALRPVGLRALDAARQVFVELDMSSPMTLVEALEATRSRTRMRDRSLQALLPPTLWERLVAVHEGHLDHETLDHMRPWAASLATYSRLAQNTRAEWLRRGRLDPRQPILDAAVALRAKARDIPVEALETPLQQVQIFSAQRFEDELRILIDLLENPEASDESLPLLDACVAFDQEGIQSATGRLMRRHPAFAERLLGERNRAWMERLVLFLPHGGMFIAVGTAHIVGDDGLVTLLREHGYRVTRVRAGEEPRRR
jgi:uncharacterized protein YbaP (TraB family)